MSIFKTFKEIDNKSLPILAATALFMQSLDGTILNTALPAIAKDIGESPLYMQSVIVSYTVTLALLIPLSGWLADKYGTKKIFIASLIIFTLGSALCAFSHTLLLLILSRVVQAIGGAMMVPVARLAVLYAYPKSKLLKVMNLITIPGLIGPVIGPSLGGILVEYYDWSWIFLINIPIGILGVWGAWKFMPNFTNKYNPFDTVGFILLSMGIVMLTITLEISTSGTINTILMLALLLLSLSFLFFYYLYARKKTNPLLDPALFKIRTFRIGLLGNLFTRLGMGGIPMLLPLLFQVGLQYSPSIAGMMLIPAAVATILMKSLLVPVVKRFGYKKVLMANTILLGLSIGLLALPSDGVSLYYYIPILFLYGSANSLQMTAMNTVSLADLTNETAGDGNSYLSIMQQLSVTIGVSFGGYLLVKVSGMDYFATQAPSLPFRYVFVILAVITIISIGLFRRLKENDGAAMSGHYEDKT